MTANELTFGGTDVAQGDTVTIAALKDGEEATAELDIAGSYRDKDDMFVVSMGGQAVGYLTTEAPIGADQDAVGGLSLDHEEGVIRTVIGVEVA